MWTADQKIAGEGARILLVGHPNVGKSVIFNRLTESATTVSNYPGTTVEVESGLAHLGGASREVVDTPGLRSLVAGSDDERVTVRCLLDDPEASVIQVGDSKNLRRTLFLTSQIIEIGVPLILDLNMSDECAGEDEVPDPEALSSLLGCPVVMTSATAGEGIEALREAIPAASQGSFAVAYPAAIERAIGEAGRILGEGRGSRGIAVLFLSGDREVEARLGPEEVEDLRRIRSEAARSFGSLPLAIHKARFDEVARLARKALRRRPAQVSGARARAATARIVLPLLGLASGWVSAYLLHSLGFRIPGAGLLPVHAAGAAGAALFAWKGAAFFKRGMRPGEMAGELWLFPSTALPLGALILYASYLFVGVFAAGECVDFLEERIFGNTRGFVEAADGSRTTGFNLGLYVPLSMHFSADGKPTGWFPVHVPWKGLNFYLSEAAAGVIGGRDHPIHELFFHEERGLIRVGLTYAIAIVLPIVTAFFLLFGLLEDSGLLPRIAILADRSFKVIGLNGKAVLPLILGLGCDTMATMTTRILETRKERTVAILLLALAVPCSAQVGIIGGAMARISPLGLSIFAAVILVQLFLVGLLASKALPGRRADFIIEVPPIRRPLLGNILGKTSVRVRWFLVEAVPLFLIGTFLLFVAGKLGVIALLARAGEPVVTGLLGLPADTTIGFILGFLRRDFAAVYILDGFIRGETADVKGAIVAITVITLFVPCFANFMAMVREKGARAAGLMAAFIFPYAVLVGGAVRAILSLVPAGWLAR